jgi:hypothetical protein
MEPIPYEIREEDVDEVLGAYTSVGGSWTAEERNAARDHVMKHALEIDETVRTAPEERRLASREVPATGEATGPDEDSPRRGMALAAIEDLLIRDGFIDASESESRIYPVAD